jgi:hypothetical protein
MKHLAVDSRGTRNGPNQECRRSNRQLTRSINTLDLFVPFWLRSWSLGHQDWRLHPGASTELDGKGAIMTVSEWWGPMTDSLVSPYYNIFDSVTGSLVDENLRNQSSIMTCARRARRKNKKIAFSTFDRKPIEAVEGLYRKQWMISKQTKSSFEWCNSSLLSWSYLRELKHLLILARDLI